MMFMLANSLPLAAEEASTGLSIWVSALIALAVVVLPFVFGQGLARALKLKDFSLRIGFVFFAITLCLWPFVSRKIDGGSWKDAIPLGIDLAGGTNMVFAVDQELTAEMEKDVDPQVMDRMVGAIIERINPSGTEEVTVRRVGPDRLEVIVPGADSEKVERIKRQITNLGELEFAILANTHDHQPLIELAKSQGGNEIRDAEGRILAKWIPSAVDADGVPKEDSRHDDVAMRPENRTAEEIPEFLVVFDPDPSRRITGDLLNRAYPTMSEGGLVVGFDFNTKGGHRFRQLTTKYQPRQGAGYKTRLAVILNHQIQSAPTINAVIGAQGVIQGRFSQDEIDELVNVLNAGALDVPLHREPVTEFTVSPLLGIDVQEKGIWAIVVAAVAVLVFMLAYYWKAGLVADICLLINVILVLGTMALIDATFTLPGLAGLVLTIGMAVDANVLIFERMREEQAKGSSLRMSIQNGFSRALSTIVDANVTTLITAVVLYMIGTDQVRGFAVTLFIGIVMSMFTALFVGRLIFDIMERKRWITSLKMGSLIGATNWNFIGKSTLAALCSAAIIVVGMGSFFARGADNLDIDFRGGSMVTFRFVDQPTVDEVRTALEGKFGSSITLEQLQVDREDGESATLFRLRTTEQDSEKVAHLINHAFADSGHKLVRQQLVVGEVTPLIAAADNSPADDPGGADVTPAAAADPFTGGHEVQLTFGEQLNALTVLEVLSEAVSTITTADGGPKYDDPSGLLQAINLDASGSQTEAGKTFLVKASPVIPLSELRTALTSMTEDLTARPNFEEINNFDSAVAGETQVDAMMALFFSLLAIIAYLWFRFQRVTFGLAAVAAVVHDVLVVLGIVAIASYLSGNPIGNFLALNDFKINLPMIAAFLTIVGYSLNDTIVVFDRIREVRGKNPALTADMVNASLNQTLSRTVLTSLTTLIVVLILYALGGEGIHGFAFCLVIGVIVGTYSTIYIASPVLLWLMNRQPATR